MLVDQEEIKTMRAAEQRPAAATADKPPVAPAAAPRPPRAPAGDDRVTRLLRIRVPVIVQLARRTMRISTLRQLSIGAIIESDKSVDAPLELLVNNRVIGEGTAVKVGENFGLSITRVDDAPQRIRSLGGER